jgi:hypothetical protein
MGMIAEQREAAIRELPGGTHRCCVRIAEVSIGLRANAAEDICLSSEMDDFRIEPVECDIEITIAWVESLQRPVRKKLFDSGAVWTMYARNDGYIIDFETPVLGARPYKRLCVNRDFSEAQLFLSRECLAGLDPVHALEYPLDELVITNWLASGKGVEVHGCGLADRASGGHLFLGHSGAGKSTTTMLWKSMRDVQILSDDRIILREWENQLWMHGTPWHGEAGFAAAGKVPIDRIFVLAHGSRNEIVPLSRSQAVGELFARSFPPFHGHRPLDSTLAYLHQIADTVPCYLFHFLPDDSAVETILNFSRPESCREKASFGD